MFNCKYCNKECKNKNSLAQHEIRCKENPEHIIVHSNLGEYLKPGHAHENQYTKAAKLGLPKPIVSEETRKKLSDKHSWKLMSNEQKAEIPPLNFAPKSNLVLKKQKAVNDISQ